jgi:hypothetical protein
MKLYNENFLASLDDDPNIALYEICKYFMSARTEKQTGLSEHLEAYALIEAYTSVNEMEVSVPPLPNDRNQRVQIILQFISTTLQELQKYVESEEEQKILQNFRGEFTAHIGKAFIYEFSDGDLEKTNNKGQALFKNS